jgi:hypothetical protein
MQSLIITGIILSYVVNVGYLIVLYGEGVAIQYVSQMYLSLGVL